MVMFQTEQSYNSQVSKTPERSPRPSNRSEISTLWRYGNMCILLSSLITNVDPFTALLIFVRWR